MINTALEPLYSRVFGYRERIYKYFQSSSLSVYFLFQDSIPVGVSLFLLRMLYIDWVPVFCWRIGFKCFGIKGPSIFVVRVILWLFKYILVDLVIP